MMEFEYWNSWREDDVFLALPVLAVGRRLIVVGWLIWGCKIEW